MRGFADAGGWVGVSFWEYAPFGRPHLYPPLFHVLELAVFKLGFSSITVARLFDLLIYPFFIFVNWRVLRELFSKELAFFNLLLVVSSYPLYLAIVNNAPFALAILFVLLSFYFLQKDKHIGSLLCLALSFYTHALMSWLGFGAILLYGFLDTRIRRNAFWVCLWSCVLAAPFLYHQARYYLFLYNAKVLEFFFFSVNLPLYILAFFGLILAFCKKGLYLFFVALTATMAVLILSNLDRFLSGQGLIPFSFLAAVFLEHLWKRVLLKNRRWVRILFFVVFIIIFYVATPVIVSSPLRKSPVLTVNSWLLDKINRQTGVHTDKGRSFYHPGLIDDAVRLVEDNSSPDDIVFSNYNYGGGMIFDLAHRATSTAMLHEVLPFNFIDPVLQARLILLFKEPDGGLSRELLSLVERYRLKKVGETGLVELYSNERCPFRRRFIPAKVPFWACFGLFLAAVAVISFGDKIRKKSVITKSKG
jgi:hypothetical protein